MPSAFPHADGIRRKHTLLATALLLAGLCLRLYFVHRWAFLGTDSLLYQDIAHNWLYAHVYGLSDTAPPRPTLIRLPGYPAVLAALAWLFDRFLKTPPGSLRSFVPVLYLQVLADLATCGLIATMAQKLFGKRAALAALALGCLCPFTANYTAVPLTETLTLFCLAAAFYTLQHWCRSSATSTLVVLAATLAAGTLLRPDQLLLLLCVLPVVWFVSPRSAVVCTLLIAVPFAAWTIRNEHTFGIFQPLAPKQAVDPGERAPLGFEHWYRTWAIDFSSNNDAYWNYPDDPIVIANLPNRAFDSPAQLKRTVALLLRLNQERKLDPAIEAEFDALAQERARTHPLRTYVLLPLARLGNMLFHPRTEMLPVSDRWWQLRSHPAETTFATLYGVLNLAYFLAALAGVPTMLRANRTLAFSMLVYIVLRCALLLTLDNAEQRYTLEFFPIVFLFASANFRGTAKF